MSKDRGLRAEVERLQAEIEQLQADLNVTAAAGKRMAELLDGVAVALLGPEPPDTAWSWHDLPERAAAAIGVMHGALDKDGA